MNYNKVYINPNFNKTSPCKYGLPDKKTHDNLNVDNLQTFSTKIYVNPSFVKTTQPQSLVSTSWTSKDLGNNITIYDKQLVNDNKQKLKTDNNILLKSAANNSRYSLVRLNRTQSSNCTVAKNPTNTVKISRYKSVPLSNIRNIISNGKCSENPSLKNQNCLPVVEKRIIKPAVINISQNNHKFIKYKPTLTTGPITNQNVGNIVFKSNMATVKLQKGKVLKKNNIPCPLYKKFGKCMRMAHGHCDFLHDNKHVSICRKFLKGVCHDKGCLLSHDLTLKKMPTCYFYLKGICNKKDCPYLHIKLSEKSKACPDFLRGYCEKGNKCFNHHNNISCNATSKSVKKKQISAKKYNTHSTSHKNNCKLIKDTINKNTDEVKELQKLKENSTEYRYYEDIKNGKAVSDKELCAVIKPSRCKLGALPSFIQL